MITKEFIEQYQTDTKAVSEAAEAALRRYYELKAKYNPADERKLHDLGYLSFTGIDDDEAQFSGDEYWAYGGHEHHYDTLPLAYLYDEELWGRVEAKWKAEAEERERKAAEETEKKRIAAEKRKRADYERLKKEFEEVVTDGNA